MSKTGRLPPSGSTRIVKPKLAARARKRPAVRKAAVSRTPRDTVSVGVSTAATTSPASVAKALQRLELAVSKLEISDPGPMPASVMLARLMKGGGE